ncbi:MAG: RNA polymerase sigma factor [Bryobacteraceae bacterium]
MNDPSSTVHQPSVRADLEDLMVRYQRADGAATTAFIAAVSPMLYRFFVHQPGSRDDAPDLLQDTWLRIHKSRYSYRPGEPVLPWLYAIARHVQVDGYRRQQRIRSREQAVDTLPECHTRPHSAAAPAPSFEALVTALPESQREVLRMLKVTGMSLEEVARATASSVGAVKQKTHRAYEKLRRILGSAANPANKELSSS